MGKGQEAVAELVAEARSCIAALPSERKGAEAVLARMDGIDLSADAVALPEPIETPTCVWLDSALGVAGASLPGLARAIAAARPWLHWITYDAYSSAIGPRFPTHHAFAGLIGEYRMIPASDFAFGLFLIAPRTLYRDHRHPAPELYVPLTDPTRWRFERGAWKTLRAGQPVWNEPNAVHATLVQGTPFLCLYAWTRDVALPAEVVPANDWDSVEAAL